MANGGKSMLAQIYVRNKYQVQVQGERVKGCTNCSLHDYHYYYFFVLVVYFLCIFARTFK